MNSRVARRPDECHVVMLAQYLPLHFVSTMQNLAKKVGRLTLLLSEPMDASRDWQPEYADLEVRVQRSLRFNIRHRHPLGFEEKGRLLIPYSTIPDLIELAPDVVIAVEAGPRTLQAALLQMLGARFRLIVQMRESESTAQSRGRLRQSVRRWLMPRVDRIFVNGNSGRRYIMGCGADVTKISIVPSGTDTYTFGRNGYPHPAEDVLKLLYVGQLIPRKGIVPFVRDLAVVAARVGRKISLTLAGRGHEEAALRAVPCPANLEIVFLGPVPYAELPALYSSAHAFVMPSWADEWGLVVNEAMACGLPVFGSSGAQAVQEMILTGYNGWTYDPDNRLELLSTLETLLRSSPESLREMGTAARKMALHLSDEYAADAIYSGISQALGSRFDDPRLWDNPGLPNSGPDGGNSP